MDADDELDLLRFQRFLLSGTRARLERFDAAIKQVVKPGHCVLDLGTGSGILALFACQAGARRVFAVDIGPVAELARLLVRENGIADRVEVLTGPASRIELPEPVDVLLTDTFDICGMQGGGLRALIDARRRFLKPGGTVIPGLVDLFLAPVNLPKVYQSEIDGWKSKPAGLDISAARPLVVNNRHAVRVSATAFLTRPARAFRLDLARADQVNAHAEVTLTATRDGVMHGVCAWFSATLIRGIRIGNRPGASSTNYAQGFFPLDRPVELTAGDEVKVALTSHDSRHWRWQVEAGGERFDHSTFMGSLLSIPLLHSREEGRTPALTRHGQAELFLLRQVDGSTTIADLRRRLLEHYQDLFASDEDAGGFITEVISRSA